MFFDKLHLANVDFVQWVIFPEYGNYTCPLAWNEIRVKHYV